MSGVDRIFWDMNSKAPVLYSTFIRCPWLTARITADEMPETKIETEGGYTYGKLHGIHSMLPWAQNESFLSKPPPDILGPKVFVIGAVDVEDRVVEHEDGVVRSESARILALRVVDVPYPFPPCEHQGAGLIVTNRMMTQEERFTEDYRHCIIQRCSCFTVTNGLQGNVFGSVDYYEEPLIIYETFTAVMLQTLLIRWYEVPELPEGVGPWREPWGWPSDSQYRQLPKDNVEEFSRAR